MQDTTLGRRNFVSGGAVMAAAVVGCVLLFFVHRTVLLSVDGFYGSVAVVGAGTLASLGFAWLDYSSFEGVFRRLARLSAAGVLVYLIIEPVDLTLVETGDARLHGFVSLCYWPAIAFAAAGVFRPSMAYAPAIYLLVTREAAQGISGIHLSSLDIKYMMDMAMFLAMSACALRLLEGSYPRLRPASDDRRSVEQCLAFSAIGMHLANYFWSGYAKLALGPTPWTWIVENPTANSILISIHKGISPLAQWPSLTQGMYEFFSTAEPLNNFAVALFQLAAIVVVFRLALLRLATLFYDALHIGIYIFGGLFFWPWIWNNVSVIYAVKGRNDADISIWPRLCCVAVMLLGGSTKLGDAALLGWFDTVDFRSPTIEMRDAGTGDWHEVPVSFFLSHSYAMSHGYYGRASREGHFSSSGGLSTNDIETLRVSGECVPPTPPDRVETEARHQQRLATLDAFLRAHHEKMRARAGGSGQPTFYLRGHHHPSNPLLFRDFAAVDLRDVDAYRYLDRSLCLTMSEGTVQERIVKQDEYIFPIDRPER